MRVVPPATPAGTFHVAANDLSDPTTQRLTWGAEVRGAGHASPLPVPIVRVQPVLANKACFAQTSSHSSHIPEITRSVLVVQV